MLRNDLMFDGLIVTDAMEMAGLVAESLKIEVQEWKKPRSWEGVFGEDVRTGAEEGLFW